MSIKRFYIPGSTPEAASHLDEEDTPGRTVYPTDYEAVLLGDSLAARRLRSQVPRIAPYLRTALIRGEPGTGKQLVARAIHDHSPGAGGPFIVHDAAALAHTMAGCGASQAQPPAAAALLQSAHGGTLYLSGVGELSSSLQTGLLHFIRGWEDRKAIPAADQSTDILRFDLRRVNIRILASSSRDLRTLAAIGQFRQDLYTRLSVVEIFVPPLRQRIEDVPTLAAHLLRALAEASGSNAKRLAAETLAKLESRLWPDNLRELKRAVVQAATLADGPVIEPRHLLALVEPPGPIQEARSFKVDRLDDVVHRHVVDVLTRCGGNKLRTAELLGISRSTLYRMLDGRSAAPDLLHD